ncbi:ABC transporter permease [Candidatus Darwinibacter acetoxidans]
MKQRRQSLFRRYGVIIIFIALIIVSAFLSRAFLTVNNMMNLLRQNAALALVSIGMLFVILTGGIDLSVGSLLALSCVLTANLLRTDPVWLVVVKVLGAGLLCGLFSGFAVVKAKVPPFVATLAMMSMARGFAYTYSSGNAISVSPTESFRFVGQGYIGPVPVPVIVAAVAAIIAGFVLQKTVFGRTLKAIGGNPEVVRLAGLPGGLYTAMAYALSAILCCISGIILTSRLNVGSPMSGVGLELDAIAAVVIGGASLSGGKGSVLNTMFGVLTLGLIGNIMNILGVPSYPQQIIKGIIILLAFIAGNEESIGSLFARFGLIKKRAA